MSNNKMSYVLIGDPQDKKHVNGINKLQLSGLYLWSTAFEQSGQKGDMGIFWRIEDLENYDIVHINYTPSNIQIPSVIREELGNNSSTKIVINVDLDVHYWGNNFSYNITNFINDLKTADVLFHVEPRGADILEHLLKRKVHTLPHPVDVSTIYDHIRKEREPIIGTIFHRYLPNTMIPFIAQRNIPLRRVLFGYQIVSKTNTVSSSRMFDQIIPVQSFVDNITEMSKCLMGCDLYEGFTYGRTIVELAALGVPTVCSSTISAAEKLFPFTSVNPYDVRGAEKLFIKLYEDEEFSNKVITHANRACSQYSLKNSYTKFIEMMEQ